MRSAKACSGWLALAAVMGLFANAERADAAPAFFLERNGGVYHYVRESGTTFASLKDKILDGYYAERGFEVLVIYCPYRAAPDYRGVPAIDFFSTNPNTGTVEDFEAMVTAAHEHGMAVVMYIGLLFVDFENATWLKAQEDKAMGVESEETRIFRWAGDPETDEPSFAGWDYSEIAGTEYATSWERPAIDLAHEEGRAYAESVLKFWMDRGVDGFEYDSPESFWGQSLERLQDLLVALPNSYTPNPKYLIAEGGTATFENAQRNDDVGFNHVLLSGDTDDRSVATDVIDGRMSVNDLDRHFVKYLDQRHGAGRGAKAVSNYSDMSAAKRALEAALLAGNGAYMEIDQEEVYGTLDDEARRAYDAVFQALARSSAQAPGATRQRLPTGTGTNQYAVLRTGNDGREQVVNIYNLGNQRARVTVDFTNTGIADGAKLFNLATGADAGPVTSRSFGLELPALGYAFLRVGGPANPAAGGGGGNGGDAGAGENAGRGNGVAGAMAVGGRGGSDNVGGNETGNAGAGRSGNAGATGGTSTNNGGAPSASPPGSAREGSGCSTSNTGRASAWLSLAWLAALLKYGRRRRGGEDQQATPP